MVMKKILMIIAILVSSTFSALAQSLEIAFALPSDNGRLSENTAKMLRSKLLPVMTENGVEPAKVSSIAIKPEISFVNKQVVEGGMRNIHTSDIQFNFICTHLITNTTFASGVITVRGDGFDDDDAIKNAISKLSSQDWRLTNFIISAKSKIVDYYQRNLNSIISRAHTFSNIQQYEEALALLFSCPTTINGYARINEEITSIYRQYQKQVCSDILQKARTEYANGNYGASAEYLQQIDMVSPCASEAKQLCSQIKASRDAEAKRMIALIERQAQREADVEKQRIKAARDAAIAYYKKRTDVYFIW